MSTPKKPRRQLFGDIISPSKNSNDVIGYVHALTEVKKSSTSTKNSYFDMNIQTSADTSKDIRVMVLQKSKFNHLYFTEKKSSAEPLKLRNLGYADSGTIFFNAQSVVETPFPHECQFQATSKTEVTYSNLMDLQDYTDGSFNVKAKLTLDSDIRSPAKCKHSVRDVLLMDNTATVKLSVWEDHFPKISDKAFYKILNLNVRQFNNEVTLTTNRFTTFELIEPFDVTKQESGNIKSICCPKILNGNINIFPTCNNRQCRKKVQGSEDIFTCLACGRTFLIETAGVELNATLQLEDVEERIYDVTIFRPVLETFFGEDVISGALTNSQELLVKLLRLNKCDFSMAVKTSIISEMKNHVPI